MITILLLHYKSLDDTRQCLLSLDKLRQKEPVEILLIDNDPDNRCDSLLKEYSFHIPITYKKNEKNLK